MVKEDRVIISLRRVKDGHYEVNALEYASITSALQRDIGCCHAPRFQKGRCTNRIPTHASGIDEASYAFGRLGLLGWDKSLS